MITNEQFTLLAQKYIDMVFRLCVGCLNSRSEAEDAVQNTFLKLLTARKDFQSEEHIKHWLIRVAVNECRRALRSPWRHHGSIDDYTSALSFETPEHSELFYAVMDLPVKYRVPLFLYYYEGYSVEETAKAVGCPVSTAKTRLRRGRELLKKVLTEVDNNG